jgi:hypothetical protein
LPLKKDEEGDPLSRFPGGGTLEVFHGDLVAYEDALSSASGSTLASSDDPRRNLKACLFDMLSIKLEGRKLRDPG